VPQAKVKLLIVDDEPSTRMSLSHIFTDLEYSVRSAADGFTALFEIRREMPDVVLSDLNMPGMSGFEFLSVVRRRFPQIHVIAMSGAFSGDGVQPGVAADAFYEKATNLDSLLQIMEAITHLERPAIQHPSRLTPIWIQSNGHDPSGEAYVMIACPECLRTFPQVLGKAIRRPFSESRARSYQCLQPSPFLTGKAVRKSHPMCKIINVPCSYAGPLGYPAISNLWRKSSEKVGASFSPEIRTGWIKRSGHADGISSGLPKRF